MDDIGLEERVRLAEEAAVEVGKLCNRLEKENKELRAMHAHLAPMVAEFIELRRIQRDFSRRHEVLDSAIDRFVVAYGRK